MADYRNLFHFRHVLRYLGVRQVFDKQRNWAIGRAMSREARDRGVEPTLLLASKTNPNATDAPAHAIAHYPRDMFFVMVDLVEDMLNARQDFFFPSEEEEEDDEDWLS